MPKAKESSSLQFLKPRQLIKSKHFSHKDVKNIKSNLTNSFAMIYLIAAIALVVIITALGVFMRIQTNNNPMEKFGFMGIVGQYFICIGSALCVVLIFISRRLENKKISTILVRIGGDVLFTAISSYMLCCIFSDAEMGFSTSSETLSAGIIFIAILALIQPMNWVDAFILDIGAAVGIISVSLYCFTAYGMQAVYYYILFALVFPFVCYMVVTLMFYVEAQRYIEIIQNERLHNRAYYDSLTKCKNRHFLNEFIKENTPRWEGKENANLLIIMFDIDNFKLYNDQFSHLGGDFCLRSICDAIRQEFPSPSLDFYRFGGEEFLLFFELKDEKEAPLILKKIQDAIARLELTAPKGAPKENVTVSLGASLLKNITTFEFEDELAVVDGYLYKAKGAGRDAACLNGTIIK